jgi:hypothetical protein
MGTVLYIYRYLRSKFVSQKIFGSKYIDATSEYCTRYLVVEDWLDPNILMHPLNTVLYLVVEYWLEEAAIVVLG